MVLFLGARLHSFIFSRMALWNFNVVRANASDVKTLPAIQAPDGYADFRLWGEKRIKAYKASFARQFDTPLGVLSIPRLQLTAPIFDGTDDLTLDRGLGRVVGTAKPGANGNLAIAGHRDGFFRILKDISKGDLIEIDLPAEKDDYSVDVMQIVDPKDVRVLASSSAPTVTLITCYPFYFVGDAPQRFIVKASLKHRELLPQTAASFQGPPQ